MEEWGTIITTITTGREWRNGSNGSYNCTPFLHSLLTKGKAREGRGEIRGGGGQLDQGRRPQKEEEAHEMKQHLGFGLLRFRV